MITQEQSLDRFEDKIRKEKTTIVKENKYSKYCDLIYYRSSIHPELTLAMRVLKPENPSYLLATTHGWHMSIGSFVNYESAVSQYLMVEVDMRGRACSDGAADCNGWELYDIIDAVEYCKKHYQEYLIDSEIVYFDAGSGGGGNAYALAGKFPDYFAAINALCGISDYLLWWQNDKVGEFRDEMEVWIGSAKNTTAYRSRSGITMVQNLCSPLRIAHGETDIRVPVSHARNYMKAAETAGKSTLIDYWELPQIGGEDHWTFLTDALSQKLHAFRFENFTKHRSPVRIPPRGQMVVCGYLVTKEFSIRLNSIDSVAIIDYDLERNSFQIRGVPDQSYTLTRTPGI